MYQNHFRLKEYPFSITPDTGFFYASQGSQAALNTLLVAIRMGEGFIKVVGEVGTGKTLLCRHLLHSLGDEFQTAYILNPLLTPQELMLQLADELGVDARSMGGGGSTQFGARLPKALNVRLLQLAYQGRRVLVCLDEAQAMPIKTLELLRLLSNLETEKFKLVQVVIFGQPELDEKLKHPSIRQLRQRITFEHRLSALSKHELKHYVHHRLTVAGHQGLPLFTAPALWLLHLGTRGYPRMVNVVAHKALICAYGRGGERVQLRDVKDAVLDTDAAGCEVGLMGLMALMIFGLSLLALGLARIR